MIRLVQSTILALFLACLAVPCAAQDSQRSLLSDLVPSGFDGLELGTELSAVPGLVPSRVVRVESPMEGDYDVDFYTREGQSMTFAGAALSTVEYGFCDGQLCTVVATALGPDNYERLLAHYLATYGTDERTAFAYDTVWDRIYTEEREDGIVSHLWIVCERQTDNCALAGLTWQERIGRAILDIGQQVNPD